MQPLFEHRRRFGGFRTRVLELEGEGPALVLLHGFADSADTWRHLLALLGERDRRAVAVDLPGFATADPLHDGRILPQLDRFTGAIVRAVAKESGEEAVIVGNSLGGCMALRAAERAGELPLAGVVPVAPAGLDMARWFALVERDPFLRTLLAIPAPLPEVVMREVVGRVYRALVFARPGEVDRRTVAAFTSHHRDRGTVRRYMSVGRAVLPELNDPECFQLERLECPVLVVWGERDRMVSPQGAQRVAESLPEAAVEIVPGCGHCPQVEAPDRLAALLEDFPSRLARAA